MQARKNARLDREQWQKASEDTVGLSDNELEAELVRWRQRYAELEMKMRDERAVSHHAHRVLHNINASLWRWPSGAHAGHRSLPTAPARQAAVHAEPYPHL